MRNGLHKVSIISLNEREPTKVVCVPSGDDRKLRAGVARRNVQSIPIKKMLKGFILLLLFFSLPSERTARLGGFVALFQALNPIFTILLLGTLLVGKSLFLTTCVLSFVKKTTHLC